MWPAWFKLLEYHRRDRLGLTLPFLIGALRTPPGARVTDEDVSIKELQSLLESMRDETPDSYYIRIMTCNNLGQPVATPGPSRYRQGSVDRQLFSSKRNICFLYAEPTYLPDEKRGIASLLESLWDHTAQPIRESRFSFRNGKFDAFSESDLRFIREALSTSEDEG
jgi:hypothetical protein